MGESMSSFGGISLSAISMRSSRRTAPSFGGVEIPQSLLELFAAVDPQWDKANRKLIVRPELEVDDECWEKVSMVILVCERWAQWSETRCARFGRSGRLFLRSLCVGVDGAIQVCYDDPECSNYYLSGFKRADAQVRLVVAVGAFAIMLIENFILQVLADDRLLRRSEELHEAVLRDMQDIIEMP